MGLRRFPKHVCGNRVGGKEEREKGKERRRKGRMEGEEEVESEGRVVPGEEEICGVSGFPVEVTQ